MRNEFERLVACQPIELLSMKRYKLPASSSSQKNDISAWQECVNNSMAQLEQQAVRIENLEQHGCNGWEKELQKLRKHIQDLNWHNFSFSSWVSLVSKNYEIEWTIVQLENEIYQIKQQQRETNKENIHQDF
uniref:Pre-mRNA-splicing factor SPF27 n=1 Tax=Microcebus murinus TaxID=30608 RepID=A0A8C5VYE3_MICMU